MIARTLSTSERYARLHETAGKLAEFCQSLYPLLVAHADDSGRQQGDEFTVKHAVHPTSPRPLADFTKALLALAQVGLVEWYQVDGRKYIEIRAFAAHQPGLKNRDNSKIPANPQLPGNAVACREMPLEEKRTEEKRTEPRGSADARKPHPARELIGDYQQRFEEATGQKPEIHGTRDASIFSGLLKNHSEDAIRAAIGAFFVDAYATQAGFPLPLFRSQFSAYAAKAARASPSRAGLHVIPDAETTRRKYLTDDPDEREPTERRAG
jgi:hypothetical protein